jgi:Sulfotransferase domain
VKRSGTIRAPEVLQAPDAAPGRGLRKTLGWDNAPKVSLRKGSAVRLPDFIGIGPARTATTWLHSVLAGHVGLPFGVKETKFFTKYYDKGIEWYAWHFRYCRPDLPMGEICPCFAYEGARERIARHIPQCRIICTFRDPVERAYSMYKVFRHYALIRHVSFEHAIDGDSRIMRGSYYAQHLLGWRSLFGKDRVLVCLYEDLRADSQGFLDRICEFIGCPPIRLGEAPVAQSAQNSFARAPRNIRLARKARRLIDRLKERQMYRTINALDRVRLWGFCFGRGEKFPPLDPAIEARLREHFLPEIEALEAMLNRDLSVWKRPLAAREEERDGVCAQSLANA